MVHINQASKRSLSAVVGETRLGIKFVQFRINVRYVAKCDDKRKSETPRMEIYVYVFLGGLVVIAKRVNGGDNQIAQASPPTRRTQRDDNTHVIPLD